MSNYAKSQSLDFIRVTMIRETVKELIEPLVQSTDTVASEQKS